MLALLFASALSILIAMDAAADWTEYGVPVSSDVYDSYAAAIAADGSNGAIIAWECDSDIYVQRVNAHGVPQWAAGGVAICVAGSDQMNARIVPDGSGGAIVAWMDRRNGTYYDIYAQRVDASGAPQWTSGGVPVCTAANNQTDHAILSDGAGGAIIVWQDLRSGTYDVYAQRLNASGAAQWTTDGLAVCAAANNQSKPSAAPDAAGGAIIAWQDLRGGSYYDIYAQRVNASGAPQWTADGIAVCAAANQQTTCSILSDGSGGAIVAWQDLRGGTYFDVYAQRVNSAGAPKWTADGVAVCTAGNHQTLPVLASDGSNGAIATWQDYRDGTYYVVYAQRVDAVGTVLWTAGGVNISFGGDENRNPRIVADGMGGAIVAWQHASNNVNVQRLDAAGTAQWTSGGIPLYAVAVDDPPAIVAAGYAGAIIAWREGFASYPPYRIYAQRIQHDGIYGWSFPVIEEIADLPQDQGGWVRMHVSRVAYDREGESFFPIGGYNIWRKVTGVGALCESRDSGAGASAREESIVSEIGADAHGTTFISEAGAAPPVGSFVSGAAAAALGLPDGTWESLGFHVAMKQDTYDFAVPTRNDSTGSGVPQETYLVTAHTTTFDAYFASDPDSAYSVDNLAPAPPAGLAAEQQYVPEGLRISWDENEERDLWCYAVYRGMTPDFMPTEADRIGRPVDPLFFDGAWRWDSGYYYKISAVDRHGNESGFVAIGPDDVTGGSAPKAPAASYLSQNFPNPFNPITKISFGLAAAGNVSLRIYDVSGRLVRMLVEGTRGEGHYTELWDGRDARGAAVASGIYFYRLDAGAFTQTKKMILLK